MADHGNDEDEELLPHDASWVNILLRMPNLTHRNDAVEQQWAYRVGYIVANVTVLALVAAVPRTALRDGDLGTMLSFALIVAASVVAYFLVQGSDPGYISSDMVREDMLLQSEVEMGIVAHEMEDDERHWHTDGDIDDPEAFRPVDGDDEAPKQTEDSPPQRLPKRCDVCDLTPLIRSHHCKACNRCVATFDHHCFVIGTCIGERNHCRFWWFIFLQSTALWFAAVMVGGSFRSADSFHKWAQLNQLAIFASFVLYVFLMYSMILLGYQTWLVMSSMTGYECIRGPENLWYLRGTDDFDLPFATTFLGNIAGFCCLRDGLCWWAGGKLWAPTQWKLPDRIDRESEDIWNHCWQNKYWSCC